MQGGIYKITSNILSLNVVVANLAADNMAVYITELLDRLQSFLGSVSHGEVGATLFLRLRIVKSYPINSLLSTVIIGIISLD